jgi:hypothetical protein
MPLIRFSPDPRDDLTLEKACENVLVTGATGSAKTTAVLALIAKTYLCNGFGGLVLCAKEDEADRWREYLDQTGRAADGRFFGIGAGLYFNFLEHEASRPGVFLENLVEMMLRVSTTQRVQSHGGDSEFWIPQKKKLIRNALELLMLAGERITLPGVYAVMRDTPQDAAVAKNRRARNEGVVFQFLSRAESRAQSPRQKKAITDLLDFYLREWPMLDKEVRLDVEADFTGTFDPLCRGELGELFCTTTNVTPEECFNGAIIVVNIPERVHYEAARHCGLIWAQCFQRAADRRRYVAPTTRPLFEMIDECHLFAGDDDHLFSSTSRSQGVSIVRACQNYPLLKSGYGNPDKVDGMAGNHVTKICCRNDDPQTVDWLSKMAGERMQPRMSVSANGRAGGDDYSLSISESKERVCPSWRFAHLANAGAEHGGIAEAVLIRPGHYWRGKYPYLVARFRQFPP